MMEKSRLADGRVQDIPEASDTVFKQQRVYQSSHYNRPLEMRGQQQRYSSNNIHSQRDGRYQQVQSHLNMLSDREDAVEDDNDDMEEYPEDEEGFYAMNESRGHSYEQRYQSLEPSVRDIKLMN